MFGKSTILSKRDSKTNQPKIRSEKWASVGCRDKNVGQRGEQRNGTEGERGR